MKKIILAAVAAFALASCTTYKPIAINGEIGPKKRSSYWYITFWWFD